MWIVSYVLIPVLLNIYMQVYGDGEYEVFFYLQHKTQPPCEGYKEWKYWVFIFSATVISFLVHFPNIAFMVAAAIDSYRITYSVTQLTYTMENNNFRKNYESIMNPLFNFMDLTSLLTWMDLRSLIMDVGFKFRLRIYIFTTAFLTINLVNAVLLVS